MKLLRWILFPVSVLYGSLMSFRNHLYNIGKKPQVEFDRTIISVGNLSMGGTGKTPMVEYLIRLLQNNYRLATLSRGYGRKTSGYRMATDTDTAETIGDEPCQYFRKFGTNISVCVGEERILAIPSAIMEKEDIDVFLLDDAYQHRKVARDFNILLSDFNHPFYEDYILPTGELRESRRGAKRADCVIITKSPEAIDEQERREIKANVKLYLGEKPVFFSHIEYDFPELVFEHKTTSLQYKDNIVLITGIADNNVFRSEMSSKYNVQKEFIFEDHHNFTSKDIDGIEGYLAQQKTDLPIVTTEKDMVRLLSLADHSLFKKTAVFYIPIRFVLEEEEKFTSRLFNVLEQKKNLN
ncbi:tetraacyldisaccharide 4'-kinase [Roseivirga sp.]|uniref:tetraacyldisaccharide 4'-kinase n=1 Tax=Roseivirga sp. TaxID=1964215 RepID=UPI002B266EA5|nr:tetraacyldisaccharide 4'-kinase [Roseivirga sp.]